MRIAVSGAGIAGPALAYWLHRSGHEPTLIEKAPRFRTAGYMVDFWGLGYTIAERMGVLPEVLKAGYSFKELRLVDDSGRRVGRLSTDVFRRKTNGRFTTVARGDLAAAIYRTVEDRVETLFDSDISGIEQCETGVRVTLEDGSARDFDLVVGADGLHSRVRQLAFGPEDQFEKQLGYRVATFEVEGYRPRDESNYVAHASPGRQFARIALRDDRTLLLFVFRAPLMTTPEPSSLAERRAILHDVFAHVGWESARILKAMEEVEDIYFDRVSQIRMQTWSKGRVMLIGDAASAVSLLAGEGTGLAMTEAYVLAGELDRVNGDYRAAFRNHENRLRPFVEGKQKAAGRFASSFLPKSSAGIWVRNQVTRLMRFPKIADLLISRSISLRDDFDLPDYGTGSRPQ
jgi:2-polyprenyl-6-methoxyphenol hydroxylase-like FAD-dependent oxidoreductase